MLPREAATAAPQPVLSHREKERRIAELQRQLHGLRENLAGAKRTTGRDGNGQVIKLLENEIADVEARLLELQPPTAAEQLTELEPKIAAVEAELRELGDRKSAAIAAKVRGEPGAATRLQQIEAQIDKGARRLTALKQEALKLREPGGETRATAAADGTVQHRLAELVNQRAKLAETATLAMHTAGDALRALEANGAAIAELEPAAANFFSVGAFRARLVNAFAPDFAIDPTKPLSPSNSLLNFGSSAIGAQSRWSLLHRERIGTDDLIPLYTSETEAEDARQRQERQGSRTLIVPLQGGVFTLVLSDSDHVHGDEGSASRAAAQSATRMAIVAHEGGFVLVPARFVEAG